MSSRRLKFLVILAWFMMSPGHALASIFSLSVRPYEGGYDLRYERIGPEAERVNREVSVAISTDIGKRYNLVQTLLEPLSTPEGITIPPDKLLLYGIRGTNRYGTLSVEQEVPVSLNRQIVYTSNQAGDADSFTLVYGIIASGLQPGSYRGRIGFTLEPIDSTESPVTTILNIFAEIEVKSSIKISTTSGIKEVFLKAGEQESSISDVIFNIRGGFGKQFRILEVVNEQPVSSDGKLLDYEAINFIGREASKGMVINEPTPLSSRQQIIYTSSPNGEADSFVISYKLTDDLNQQKAGRYRTNIRYTLEGLDSAKPETIDSLALEIENPRVFDLVVTPEQGGLIQFKQVKPLQPPKQSEVTIQIKSNIGKRYQLTQKAISPLTDKEGNVIAEEYFTLKLDSLETKGELKFGQRVAVKTGDSILFVSDPEGASDKFKINYELSLPADYRAGDYSTRIIYSLSEI